MSKLKNERVVGSSLAAAVYYLVTNVWLFSNTQSCLSIIWHKREKNDDNSIKTSLDNFTKPMVLNNPVFFIVNNIWASEYLFQVKH